MESRRFDHHLYCDTDFGYHEDNLIDVVMKDRK